MEVVEQNRQVVVQALGWLEVQLQHAAGDRHEGAGLSSLAAP